MLRLAMHFASGNSLVSGLAMLLIAFVILSTGRQPRRWAVFATRMLAFLGTSFVTLSTIPLGFAAWLALGLAAAPLIFRLVKPFAAHPTARQTQLCMVLFAAVGLAVIAGEYLRPSAMIPASVSGRPIVVIGDSLSATETDPKITAWPELIAAQGRTVFNRARMGATAASALKQASIGQPDDAVVLVMIGGNDLLGPTSPQDFETTLEELVRTVSGKGVDVVLFELPLPPFQLEWGAIQRRVAATSGCRLATRRIIAQVLGGSGNTVDGIHLSQKGHEEMARLVMERVLPSD